jgi:4-amino-4-deoxy-L-arabinose transferase-like glycosyltransferase
MAPMAKLLKPLILMLLILQLLTSMGFELAHDEAYYWLYSRHLDWGFFDHPPMVGLVIKAFSFLPHGEGAVRFGFILMQFSALICLLRMIEERKRFLATLLYFAFPLNSVAGLLALPDMPLVFFSTLYCYFLKRYLEESNVKISLALGLVIALLLYTKYHGILLIFFTILALPRLLLNRHFYLVALTALILFLPHVFWQYEHQFATLRYHFIERPSAAFSLSRSAEYVITQVGLAGVLLGPFLWWSVIREKASAPFERALKFIALGTVSFFLLSSFSKKIEANWTIFLVVPMVLLAVRSDWLSSRRIKGLLYLSFSLVILSRLLFLFPDFPVNRIKEFHGWADWAKEVNQRCPEGIVANSYQIAAKISYYLNQDIPALNYRSRKNQNDFWQFRPSSTSEKICYLTDKSEFTGPEISTPEFKKLKVVTEFSWDELQAQKKLLER